MKTSVKKHLLHPTPPVNQATTMRRVHLKSCQAQTLIGNINDDLHRLLDRKPLNAHFPITAQACLDLIQTLAAQQPDMQTDRCCIELEYFLTESQIYHINQWRTWREDGLADDLQRIDPSNLFGVVAASKIESAYQVLTDIRARLAAPIKTG